MTEEPRYAVRRRANGYFVVDMTGGKLAKGPFSPRGAEKLARELNIEEEIGLRTYAVLWYVEVDAINEDEAEAKARKYLGREWRENWPVYSVEEIDPEIEGNPNATGREVTSE